MPPYRRNSTAPNITEMLLRSAPRTSLGELIALPRHCSSISGGRKLRRGGKEEIKEKERKGKEGGNRMMAGREKLENGEIREA